MLWHYLQIVVIFGHLDQAFANDLFLLLSLLKSQFNILPHLLWRSCWTCNNDIIIDDFFNNVLSFSELEPCWRVLFGQKEWSIFWSGELKSLNVPCLPFINEKKSGFQKENWTKLFYLSIAPFSNNKQHMNHSTQKAW